MLSRFGLPEAVVAAGRSALSTTLSRDVIDSLYSEGVAQGVARALEWAQHPSHALVALDDPAYPKALLEISDPPALLYAVGRLELLGQPALAVVGSRNATAQGARNAQAFARALSDSGLTIVSGLALGVDAAAHRGGLEGRRSTIAVLGTGVDIVYPPGNAALAREIAGRGLLVSEFALGHPANKHNFPRRNRVISGLTLGTLVVEAALSSGSLITARAALEQGREVFAVPGSIHSPLSKGCHSLIKSGAKLVESAEDVLSELGAAYRRNESLVRQDGVSQAATIRPSAGRSPLLEQMGFDPVDIDSLCARAGLTAQQVSAELLRLEMEGEVAALPGGLYQRLHS